MDNLKEIIFTVYCCPVSTCTCEYKSKFNLKRHIKYIHKGEKPFSCPTCSRVFVSKQNLTEHQHIHSGTKAYRCANCGQRFRYMSQLSLHKRTHNPNYEETLNFVNQIQEDE